MSAQLHTICPSTTSVAGELPLVLATETVDTIGAVLRVKDDVESALLSQAADPKSGVVIGGFESHLVADELAAAEACDASLDRRSAPLYARDGDFYTLSERDADVEDLYARDAASDELDIELAKRAYEELSARPFAALARREDLVSLVTKGNSALTEAQVLRDPQRKRKKVAEAKLASEKALKLAKRATMVNQLKKDIADCDRLLATMRGHA
ncbi:hypothetical protein MMC13_006560 [Lambiella insularis]|nr:hypothetical protein [Lambiella insularis]